MGTLFLALCGQTNAGKSSLINCIVQSPWMGVSPKPQTTRKTMQGIYTDRSTMRQLILQDCPGFVDPESIRLGEMFQERIDESARNADSLILVVRSSEDKSFYASAAFQAFVTQFGHKIRLVVLNSDGLYRHIDQVPQLPGIPMIDVSIYDPDAIQRLRNLLLNLVPAGLPVMFDPDQVAVETVRELATEIFRAVLLDTLQAEVPYESVPEIRKIDEAEKRIYVDLIVNRASQKPILLGEGGGKLREIRQEIQRRLFPLLGQFQIELFVRVEPNWIRDRAREFGF